MRLLFSLPVFLLPVCILFSGCSVFSPIGKVIADGYENTVAYFNSYYNASRLFSEAEDEILANERTLRSQSGISRVPVPAPPAAKQKLTLVIDKCSHILTFYPTSALVDDALFLVGKSYFYQGEYLKAERKFAELLSGFPGSDHVLEAELWFLKTLLRLKKYEETATTAEILLQKATEDGEEEIAAEVQAVRGELFSLQEDRTKALEAYHNAVDLSSNDLLRSLVQYRIADELFRAGRFAEAAEAFLKVEGFTNEAGMIVSSRLQAIRSFRLAGNHRRALELCNSARDDFRFVQKEKDVLLERGVTYAALGEFDRALPELLAIDTSSARTEIGSKAAFEVAKIQENHFRDYRSAREAYGRAIAYPSPAIIEEARRRSQAFGRYFTLWKQRQDRDSVYAALFALRDSVPSNTSFIPPSPGVFDSLKLLQAVNAYELGEVFYAELEEPDSAVFWYRRALRDGVDSSKAPRILFVLAELSASNPEKQFGDPVAQYGRILDEYPSSPYALRAKIQLGMPVEQTAVDSGQIKYRKAETAIDAGRMHDAIAILKEILRNHPFSSYAAKSGYALGYLYEYHLAQPDSALMHYRNLLEAYGASSYATAVKGRIPSGVQQTVSDSLALPQKRLLQESRPVQPSDTLQGVAAPKPSPGLREN